MSRLICIILMVCLPLQAFALQRDMGMGGKMYSLAHEMEHAEGISHHHEEDGTVHYDDSVESKLHLAESSSVHWPPGLPTIVVLALPLILSCKALEDPPAFFPDRVPEQPQRPPSSSLG